jgi:hypothetical protein
MNLNSIFVLVIVVVVLVITASLIFSVRVARKVRGERAEQWKKQDEEIQKLGLNLKLRLIRTMKCGNS